MLRSCASPSDVLMAILRAMGENSFKENSRTHAVFSADNRKIRGLLYELWRKETSGSNILDCFSFSFPDGVEASGSVLEEQLKKHLDRFDAARPELFAVTREFCERCREIKLTRNEWWQIGLIGKKLAAELAV